MKHTTKTKVFEHETLSHKPLTKKDMMACLAQVDSIELVLSAREGLKQELFDNLKTSRGGVMNQIKADLICMITDKWFDIGTTTKEDGS